MCGKADRHAVLLLAVVAGDGSTHNRSWMVCGDVAAGLAAILGPPLLESIASSEAVKDIAEQVSEHPGLVIHRA